MSRSLFALVGAVLALAGPAAAEERMTLGIGRMFDNDWLGDGEDRWRTGGYTVSVVRGPYWDGTLPDQPGQIVEYRFRTEIIAPSELSSPPAGDRRYAGILSFGVHTQFQFLQAETSLGVDIVAVGPQTGVGDVQDWLHDQLSYPDVSVLDDQIGNRIAPTFVGEMGKTFQFSDNLTVRPFVETRAGDETMLRVGGDIAFGRIETGALWGRDTVTGQRYVMASGQSDPGASFVLGGDAAYVADSIYLPSSGPAAAEDGRYRLRAGMQIRSQNLGVFYGVTWLSKEFESQPEEQVVGSLRLRLNF